MGSYRLEWIAGIAVFGGLLLMLIVPEFAVIAVVFVTLAALVALVALIAAALAAPYLLVRSLRRRLLRATRRRRTSSAHASSAIRVAPSVRRPAGTRGPALQAVAVHRDAIEDRRRRAT